MQGGRLLIRADCRLGRGHPEPEPLRPKDYGQRWASWPSRFRFGSLQSVHIIFDANLCRKGRQPVHQEIAWGRGSKKQDQRAARLGAALKSLRVILVAGIGRALHMRDAERVAECIVHRRGERGPHAERCKQHLQNERMRCDERGCRAPFMRSAVSHDRFIACGLPSICRCLVARNSHVCLCALPPQRSLISINCGEELEISAARGHPSSPVMYGMAPIMKSIVRFSGT